VKRPEDGRWSSYNNIDLEKPTVAACIIPIDDVRLPLGQQALGKRAVRTALTVATRSRRRARPRRLRVAELGC
jgi:hypothetical protein